MSFHLVLFPQLFDRKGYSWSKRPPILIFYLEWLVYVIASPNMDPKLMYKVHSIKKLKYCCNRCTWICYIYLCEWNVICQRMETELLYIKVEHAPTGMSQNDSTMICFHVAWIVEQSFVERIWNETILTLLYFLPLWELFLWSYLFILFYFDDGWIWSCNSCGSVCKSFLWFLPFETLQLSLVLLMEYNSREIHLRFRGSVFGF